MSEKQSGFTLIELMTTVACMAILAAVVIPNWIASAWPAYRLKNAAKQVVSDIRYARMRAISTNHPYRLRFDPLSDAYFLERGNPSGGSLSWAVEGPGRCFAAGGNTSCLGVRIAGEKEFSAVFRPTGGMTATTITLKNTLDHTVKIVGSMAGRIRMVRE